MLTQNTFSRTVVNERKMGAYYTDLAHCRIIRKMFQFPDEEVSVLEPSIGDGSAVIAVTNADTNPNIKIFGVELNDTVAKSTQENPYITECLNADFLDGVRIKNNCFSFCFGNPPYLEDRMDGQKSRAERAFLENVGYYLVKGAILVWVIPYGVFTDPSYYRYWNTRYETLRLFRFQEKEFAKYHQVVIVGKKRDCSRDYSKQDLERMLGAIDSVEKIPELPTDEISLGEKICVPASVSANVTPFTTKSFDPASAASILEEELPLEIGERFDKRITVPSFVVNDIGNPPIPLKKDSLYLLATAGGGQGLTGSEENNDLHLQRGVAKVIEEETVAPKGSEEDDYILKVLTRTQITMTVVQNNGKIDILQ